MRLIDADNLIKEIHRYALDGYDINLENSKEFAGSSKAENYCEGLYEATELIDDAPTIDAELVRHGHWEFCAESADMYDCKCSVCGSIEQPLQRHHYCPNCGARMSDEVEE